MSLAELIPFRSRAPEPVDLDLEFDPDFEQECHQSLQEPIPTPLERLRDGTTQVLDALRKQDKVHADRLADLSEQLAKEGEAKAANLGEIARIERALEQLRDEPVPVPATPAKRKGRG